MKEVDFLNERSLTAYDLERIISNLSNRLEKSIIRTKPVLFKY
jgi:hypothetical protein